MKKFETYRVDDDDDDDDFEDWEGDYDLMEAQDWEGLLKLRKGKIDNNPDDYYAKIGYGEALVLNEKFNEAIAYLGPIYYEDPDMIDVIHTLLDALYKNGKTENDFKWIEPPAIKKLNSELIDECYLIAKKKKSKTHVEELCHDLFLKEFAYLNFTSEELANKLKEDKRFKFDENDFIVIK